MKKTICGAYLELIGSHAAPAMLGMDATCGQRALLTEGPLKAELEHRSFVHLGRLPIDLLAVRQVAVWRARSIQAARCSPDP